MRRALIVLVLVAQTSGCNSTKMQLINHLDLPVDVEIRAPKPNLTGGCMESFTTRFCAEEYEDVGVIQVGAHQNHQVGISDTIDANHCTNVLWLRLVRLDKIGPVDDPGTLFALPVDAQIEQGAGAIHTVAFPQETVRLDQAGLADDHQGPPPPTCASLGRTPR
jgi:hypothetical protein